MNVIHQLGEPKSKCKSIFKINPDPNVPHFKINISWNKLQNQSDEKNHDELVPV